MMKQGCVSNTDCDESSRVAGGGGGGDDSGPCEMWEQRVRAAVEVVVAVVCWC